MLFFSNLGDALAHYLKGGALNLPSDLNFAHLDRLTLVGDRVVVEQERGGRAIRREFNRQWVRVEVDRERWTREPRLVLRSGRDALRFGETVPASERMALARRIRGMLGAR